MRDSCILARRRLVDSPRPDNGLRRFMHGVAVLLRNQSIGGVVMALNGIANPDVIYAGQTIRVK